MAGALTAGILLTKKYPTYLLSGRILPIFLFVGIALLLIIQLEPYHLTVRRQTIETGKLSANIKIALMSDVHLRPLKEGAYLEKVAQKVSKENPDLIFFAGDFLFYDHVDSYEKDFRSFKKFSEIAPAYAVLGNHDYGIGDSRHSLIYKDQHEKIIKLLERSGIKVLIDENLLLDLNGQKIQLVGFDEFWHWNKKPDQAFKDLQPEGLRIGLSHNPDAAYLPESQKLDILLAGHTHGGQMRLPLVGALAEAETSFPRVNYGQFVDNSKPKIFNTVGLGESGFPIRLFNPPEIAILNIR